MCSVPAAIILSTVASGAYQKYQNDENNAKMEKRQREAENKAAAEKNAMDRNMSSAETTPLLLSKGKAGGAKGVGKLKVDRGGAGGYSSLGLGGTGGTGLNIAPRG